LYVVNFDQQILKNVTITPVWDNFSHWSTD